MNKCANEASKSLEVITLFAMYIPYNGSLLYSRFKFSCLVFLGMELIKNEVETKKNKTSFKDKVEP